MQDEAHEPITGGCAQEPTGAPGRSSGAWACLGLLFHIVDVVWYPGTY